jgi:hypothetical protein
LCGSCGLRTGMDVVKELRREVALHVGTITK